MSLEQCRRGAPSQRAMRGAGRRFGGEKREDTHESEYQDSRGKLSRFRNTIVLNTMAVASVGRQMIS